jgi:hypothetical protein
LKSGRVNSGKFGITGCDLAQIIESGIAIKSFTDRLGQYLGNTDNLAAERLTIKRDF